MGVAACARRLERRGKRLLMPPQHPSQAGRRGLGILRRELHFCGNDDGVIERQSCHAHRRAGMLSDVGSIEFKDQVREAIEDVGGLPIAWFRVDHARDHQPGGHAIEIPEFSLETGKHREGRGARCLLGGFQGDLGRDLSKGAEGGTVRSQWAMASQIEPIATHTCPGERKGESWWELRGLREHESFFLELGFNLHGSVLLAVVCQRGNLDMKRLIFWLYSFHVRALFLTHFPTTHPYTI